MAFSQQERAKAISEGKSKYFTGRPCKHGHIAERRVDNGACSVCEAERIKKWFAENPEKVKRAQRKTYANRAEKCRQYAAQYRANNQEKVRESYRKSKLKNRAYHTYLESQRQKRVKQATPSWLTKEDKQLMIDIYKLSKQIKDEYGIVTAVDHIIPIRGKTVCGLNVPSNLRVVTQKYNSKKSNEIEEHPPIYKSNSSIMVHESALPWNLRS